MNDAVLEISHTRNIIALSFRNNTKRGLFEVTLLEGVVRVEFLRFFPLPRNDRVTLSTTMGNEEEARAG